MRAKWKERKTSLATAPRPFFLPLFPYFSRFLYPFFIEKPFWATFNVVQSTILSPKLWCIRLNELHVCMHMYICVCTYAMQGAD